MKYDLDTCSLNRPWDDQQQTRIHLEAEAVLYLLDATQQGEHSLVTSDYLLAEIAASPDPERNRLILACLEPASLHVSTHPQIEALAETLGAYGIQGFDAFHLACAEIAQCECLLTTDDRLIKRAARAKVDLLLRLNVLNPLHFPPYFHQPE